MGRKSAAPELAALAVKVLIVDDHPLVREGLAMQIAMQPNLTVCGQAENIPAALALLESESPDLAIIDISLKNGNGIELIERIKDRNDDIKFLVLSMYPESLFAERALQAGAHGYIHKGQATKHLLLAIQTVMDGKVYVSGEFGEKLGRGEADVSQRSGIESLSTRELQAFELMGQGMTTESIANQMRVSPKTIETYRARIKEKLELNNVTEVIQRATQWVLEAK